MRDLKERGVPCLDIKVVGTKAGSPISLARETYSYDTHYYQVVVIQDSVIVI